MLGDPWASKVSQSSTVLSPWMTGDILLRTGKDSYRNLTSTGKYSLPVTQFPGHRPKKNEAESYSQGGTVKPNIFLSVKISIMWYAGVGKSSRCSDLIQNANFTFTIGYFNSTGKKIFFFNLSPPRLVRLLKTAGCYKTWNLVFMTKAAKDSEDNDLRNKFSC